MIPQADDYVDSRRLAYLGGAKTLIGRTGWYTGKLKMLVIWTMGYYTIAPVNELVPSIAVWTALLVVFGIAVMVVDYAVFWPSEIIFSREHNERENRSPLRGDTQEIIDRLEALDRK